MFGMAGETDLDLRFELFRIPVRVHPIFWISSAMIVWDGDNPARIVLGVLCIFFSVLVHELGHAIVIRRYGYPSEIVLYVLGGYATSAHFPFRRAVTVSLAGPLTGLAVAAVIYVVGQFFLLRYLAAFPQLLFMFYYLMFGGLIVNVLNLFPVLPLDGGQIMAACIREYGPRGVDRHELALKASVAVSAALCLWAARCHSSRQAFFPEFFLGWIPGQNFLFSFDMVQPDPQFLAIFMGYLCANSLMALKRF